MSRSSHLELLSTDSQALDPPDSVSLASEPPDIRKWFSSYIYESPELNTSDGFGDINGSGEICLEEEKEGKFGENRHVGKSDYGLLSAEKESSDGIAECGESVRSAAMVTGSSGSLSFCSEPPDIKNWFSSYLHESPPLDATDDFTISDCEDVKLSTTQKSCRKDTKDVMNFIHVEESRELLSHNRKSMWLLNARTCRVWAPVLHILTYLFGPSKLCSGAKLDSHYVHLKRFSSTPSQLTSKMVSEQMLPGQETGNPDHDFGRKSGNENTYDVAFNRKLDCSLIDNKSPKLLNIENNTGSQVQKSLHKSIGTKNCVKDSLVKKELDEIVSAGAFDLSEHKVLEKDAKTSRKVLSETSNLHSPNALESTGKWCCPQKNKPSLGPPLKQLRLEQWVRRA
ncbi:hypothetical protein Sango_2297700 [Sesamum angolense]|uniref:Uncharacterized protein n=1 Tax=Sesamum angolense TaxID=2727404 RepID=A0AAE1WA75_9LAMI|nr:hypothetical protein Sango_2297700 [Sesamum angolense]